jgi:hypothetical protein|tara:strand:+ start:599 stop:787 length:189 start_codon:yes stop_codon:yes gene_type:complete
VAVAGVHEITLNLEPDATTQATCPHGLCLIEVFLQFFLGAATEVIDHEGIALCRSGTTQKST